MRRAIVAVLAGATVLAGSACDSDATSTDTTAASSPPSVAPSTAANTAPPDYSASTRLVCDKLKTLYTTELRAFGTAMGKMVTYKEEKQTSEAEKAERVAAGQLQAAATKIRKETAAAENPDFQAAGKVSAAKLETSAKDRKYMDKVKTLTDLNKSVEAQFTEWLNPVAGYCG